MYSSLDLMVPWRYQYYETLKCLIWYKGMSVSEVTCSYHYYATLKISSEGLVPHLRNFSFHTTERPYF